MNDFEFSLAKIEDVPEILKLYDSLIGTPGCTWSEDYPGVEITERDINNEALYVLRSEGRIVAVASISANFGDNLRQYDWRSQNPCEMARIGVLPSLHGRGIGEYMMRLLADAAKERGFDGMMMLATRNSTGAQAIADKLGYHQYDEIILYDVRFRRYEIVF